MAQTHRDMPFRWDSLSRLLNDEYKSNHEASKNLTPYGWHVVPEPADAEALLSMWGKRIETGRFAAPPISVAAEEERVRAEEACARAEEEKRRADEAENARREAERACAKAEHAGT
mmetsp:Transcript_7617/g.15223  ORF Transcript_7617/g.15223 Transcript_7617/m.15223 type:complete len:116 (-) Transcript_7617:132-479(-)